MDTNSIETSTSCLDNSLSFSHKSKKKNTKRYPNDSDILKATSTEASSHTSHFSPGCIVTSRGVDSDKMIGNDGTESTSSSIHRTTLQRVTNALRPSFQTPETDANPPISHQIPINLSTSFRTPIDQSPAAITVPGASSTRSQEELPLAASRLQPDNHVVAVHLPVLRRPRSASDSTASGPRFLVSTSIAATHATEALPGDGESGVDVYGRVHESPPPYVEVELHRTVPATYYRTVLPSEPPPPYFISGQRIGNRTLQEDYEFNNPSRSNNPVQKDKCYQKAVCFFATILLLIVIVPIVFILFKND